MFSGAPRSSATCARGRFRSSGRDLPAAGLPPRCRVPPARATSRAEPAPASSSGYERAGGRRRARPDEGRRTPALRGRERAAQRDRRPAARSTVCSTRCRSRKARRTSCCSTVCRCSSSPLSSPVAMPGAHMGLIAPWPYPSRRRSPRSTRVTLRGSASSHARARGRLHLTARLIGQAVRVVLVPAWDRPPVRLARRDRREPGAGGEGSRAVVRAASARRWLPGFVRRSGRDRRDRRARRMPRDLASCALSGPRPGHRRDDRRRPRPRPRRRRRDRLGRALPSTASPTSLYVASERWDARPDGSQPPTETTTAIHRFDIASPTQTHRGGSSVPGVL